MVSTPFERAEGLAATHTSEWLLLVQDAVPADAARLATAGAATTAGLFWTSLDTQSRTARSVFSMKA
jgi:hypothetical protein